MPVDEQTALGNAGAPFVVTWNDGGTLRRFPVSFLVQRVKAKLVRACKLADLADLNELRPGLDEPTYKQLLGELLAKAKGLDESSDPGKPGTQAYYAYDGKRVTEYRGSAEGKMAFVRALLGEAGEVLGDDELIRLVAEKGDEIGTYAQLMQANVEDLLRQIGFDPKAEERRVRAELGLAAGAEPSPEQQAVIDGRLAKYAETLDPKALTRCLKAAGLMA